MTTTVNQRAYWQRFINSIDGKSSSQQLAAGLVFGMLIGLMPKDSLLLIVIAFLLIMSPANLVTALLSATVFSVFGSWEPIQSLMHSIGLSILNVKSLEPTFARFFSSPLVPWTRLDNTVVMGSLFLGLSSTAPVYFSALKLFDRFGEFYYQKIRDSIFCRWLIGTRNSKLNEGQA